MKNSLLLLTLVIGALLAFKPGNPFMDNLQERLEAYRKQYPQETIYLQTDKTFAKPGEDVWYKIQLRDAVTFKPSEISDICYVEFIDPRGNVLGTQTLICKDGAAVGDFHIDEGYAGGIYRIRAHTLWMDNTGDAFEREITVQRVVLPNLNMRLQFVQDAYGKGEDIMASLDLNTLSNQHLAKQPFTWSLQIAGATIQSGEGISDENGKAYVKATLPADLKTNDGLLSVQIPYQGQTESISRSVPIVLGGLDLQFLPEGGALLEGATCRLAFKALDEFGKPADVSGYIENSKGEKITSFVSYHKGMGAIDFTPAAGETYTAVTTKPFGGLKTAIPAALPKGVAMKVTGQTDKTLTCEIYATEAKDYPLVLTHGGERLVGKIVSAQKGRNVVTLDISSAPMGIAVLTLFNDNDVAAERLTFLNLQKRLNVKIKTNKEKYQPRDKVTVSLNVTDEKGVPVRGDFALSVVDDKLLTFADDKQGHLLAALLLENNIPTKIEEPDFYFDNEKDETRFKPDVSRTRAMDYLLLTQGWRRFTWANQPVINQDQAAEKAIVTGVVYNEEGNPFKGVRVQSKSNPSLVAYTDENGQYALKGLVLTEAQDLVFKATGYPDRKATAIDYANSTEVYMNKTIAISGIVYGSGKNPLGDAIIMDKNGNELAYTEWDGRFNIEVPMDTKQLFVQEYSYKKTPLNIIAGKTDGYKVTLIPIPPQPVRKRPMAKGNMAPVREMEVQEEVVMADMAMPDRPMQVEDAPMPVEAPMVWNAAPAMNHIPAAAEVTSGSVVNLSSLAAPVAVDWSAASPVGTYTLNVTDANANSISVEDKKEIAIEGNVAMDDLRGQKVIAQKDVAAGKAGIKFVEPVVRNEDELDGDGEMMDGEMVVSRFYKARQFYEPKYVGKDALKANTLRNDFRNTIYWNPFVKTDALGNATVSFYASDAITAFRVSVEGLSNNGQMGSETKKFYTQLPFSLGAKIPSEVLTNDKVNIPLTLTNNTANVLQGTLKVKAPANFKLVKTPPTSITLNPNETKTILVETEILNKLMEDEFEVTFVSGYNKDRLASIVRSRPKGFPVMIAKSGGSGEALSETHSFTVVDPIEGSLKVSLTAYPNALSETLTGIDQMLRQPGGCFEQTTSGNYPNVLALAYLRETNTSNPSLEATTKGYLDQGYKILTGYESPSGGFDWWGRDPGHEALSAMGLMQFVDMKKVYPSVDQAMLDRTAKWLLSRRDGKGGFIKNPNALHSWADDQITDAFIVFCMAEAGYGDKITAELNKSYQYAISSEDPYTMALMANAMLAIKDTKRAATLNDDLLKRQAKDGSFTGLKTSVVMSTGQTLQIETTSLVILSFLKANVSMSAVQNAIKFLNDSKGYFGYGSTLSNAFSLKALLRFAQSSKKTESPGDIVIYQGGKKVKSLHYGANTTAKNLTIDGLESLFAAGKNDIEVRFENTKEPLKYDLSVTYNTRQPNSQKDCAVNLTTKLAQSSVKQGGTLRLAASVQNRSNEKGQPMTMMMVGIPAGLSLQPWQLKELMDKKACDFYELYNGYAVFSFEELKPGETRTINLDLKADIPGTYEAPASCAFLYYTNEYKVWSAPDKVTIL